MFSSSHVSLMPVSYIALLGIHAAPFSRITPRLITNMVYNVMTPAQTQGTMYAKGKKKSIQLK